MCSNTFTSILLHNARQNAFFSSIFVDIWTRLWSAGNYISLSSGEKPGNNLRIIGSKMDHSSFFNRVTGLDQGSGSEINVLHQDFIPLSWFCLYSANSQMFIENISRKSMQPSYLEQDMDLFKGVTWFSKIRIQISSF